jgi:hypothetical protein
MQKATALAILNLNLSRALITTAAAHARHPRHFVETAEKSGVGKPVVSDLIEELRDSVSAVVDSVISGLPKGFPEAVAGSIQKGVKRRLKLWRNQKCKELTAFIQTARRHPPEKRPGRGCSLLPELKEQPARGFSACFPSETDSCCSYR